MSNIAFKPVLTDVCNAKMLEFALPSKLIKTKETFSVQVNKQL